VARKRRAWESLTPEYRKRLQRGGITKRDYERGRNLSAARGHYATPEHGLRSAQKNPQKYQDYIRKRSVPAGSAPRGQTPEEEARELNMWKDRAFKNIKSKLHDIYKYFEPTVEANVYGGFTRESGEVKGMNLSECKWTAAASRDELRAHAYPQYRGNPWWYH
jgi:hypothetical protein